MYYVTILRTSVKTPASDESPFFKGYILRGKVNALPVAGERWVVTLLNPDDDRPTYMFTTSVVQTAVWNENRRTVLFETENSIYHVDYTLDKGAESGVE